MLNLAKYVRHHATTGPQRVAVFAEGQSLTYAELARRAANLASALHASGALQRPGPLSRPCVGVIASRSIDACIAVLGCAWAGATYVPIGPKTPPERLQKLMGACAPVALIADAQGSRLLPAATRIAGAPDVVLTSPHALPDAPPPALHTFEPSDLAYIVFTSGTTGVPKGVMISQAAVDAFVEMIGTRLCLTADDRTLEVTELGFDVSVMNMFATWQVGASLHVLPAVRVMNAVGFAREQRLTIWSSTPSLIALLRQVKALAPGALPDLRLALLAGEPLSTATLETFCRAAPSCVVEDLYGPTEATVVNIGQRIDRSYVVTPGRDLISIGMPLPGNRAGVLVGEGRWAETGQIGELALSGVQLAEGYLGAPELTARKFPTIAGERWYLTGDSAYRDEHGFIHHLGRLDNQLKILGNRVERDEIELRVRELSGLQLVAALPWPTREGVHHGLVVFLAGEQHMSSSALLSALGEKLPAYMLPSRLIWLEHMPLNTNGKIDRHALLAMLDGAEA
jgi:D-alanine--poly(phosphoribitol) ligase subunit 1